jgi:hypothetical protein
MILNLLRFNLFDVQTIKNHSFIANILLWFKDMNTRLKIDLVLNPGATHPNPSHEGTF